MFDPVVITAAIGAVGTLGGIVAGMRQGRANADKTRAEADVLVSAEARALAADTRAMLEAERAERRRLEEKIDQLEAAFSGERQRCADHIAELERAMRRAGLHVPGDGDTPPGGTPTVGGGE